MEVYADSSAWIALILEADGAHGRARAAHTELQRQGARYLLSDYVLDETVTRIKRFAGAHRAINAGRLMQAGDLGDLRKVDAEDFANAWRLFQKHADQSLSFTDCTILAQMDRLGIDTVFTFDKGFEKAGKKVVPES